MKWYWLYLKRMMYHSELGFQFALVLVRLKNVWTYRLFLSDESVIKRQFRRAHGYNVDLNNPVTFNEKTQWIKLFERTPQHTLFADKLAVRDIMRERYGEDGLVPLLFRTKNWKEIGPENMPDFPFIIKPNHGSGWYHIIHDKAKVDWNKVKTDCRFWLTQNYYYMQREWQYKNIVPEILVEKLLIPSYGGLPNNYRLHCLGGLVEVVSVNICFGDPTVFVAKKFNKNWELLDFEFGTESKSHPAFENISIEMPVNFNRMVTIAEDIAKNYPYVRVDFFEVDGKMYYGEITFHDSGGYDKINPFSWDELLGSKMDLSKSKSGILLS